MRPEVSGQSDLREPGSALPGESIGTCADLESEVSDSDEVTTKQ